MTPHVRAPRVDQEHLRRIEVLGNGSGGPTESTELFLLRREQFVPQDPHPHHGWSPITTRCSAGNVRSGSWVFSAHACASIPISSNAASAVVDSSSMASTQSS